MIKVYPYRQGSGGAANLAEALGARVLRLQGSRYRPNRRDVVINWGSTDDLSRFPRGLNLRGIQQASNKLSFFRTVSEAAPGILPAFWENPADIPDEAFPVVCRTSLAGHSGEGIVIAETRDGLVAARLYTKYIPKQHEYRIHVGKFADPDRGPRIISVQRKARRHDHDNPDWRVRNLQNGFVYARADVNPPDCVIDVACRALCCTELDFGAVDVIFNERQNRAYVLEINTAPGISGTTVDDYVDYFNETTQQL